MGLFLGLYVAVFLERFDQVSYSVRARQVVITTFFINGLSFKQYYYSVRLTTNQKAGSSNLSGRARTFSFLIY